MPVAGYGGGYNLSKLFNFKQSGLTRKHRRNCSSSNNFTKLRKTTIPRTFRKTYNFSRNFITSTTTHHNNCSFSKHCTFKKFSRKRRKRRKRKKSKTPFSNKSTTLTPTPYFNKSKPIPTTPAGARYKMMRSFPTWDRKWNLPQPLLKFCRKKMSIPLTPSSM